MSTSSVCSVIGYDISSIWHCSNHYGYPQDIALISGAAMKCEDNKKGQEKREKGKGTENASQYTPFILPLITIAPSPRLRHKQYQENLHLISMTNILKNSTNLPLLAFLPQQQILNPSQRPSPPFPFPSPFPPSPFPSPLPLFTK